MAVLTANSAVKDDFLRGPNETADYTVVGAVAGNGGREVQDPVIAERLKKLERICAEGRIKASKYGITEEDVYEAIREVREEERARKK